MDTALATTAPLDPSSHGSGDEPSSRRRRPSDACDPSGGRRHRFHWFGADAYLVLPERSDFVESPEAPPVAAPRELVVFRDRVGYRDVGVEAVQQRPASRHVGQARKGGERLGAGVFHRRCVL